MAESSELCSASPGAGVMDMFGASCTLCGPRGREAAREGLSQRLLPRPELSQPRLSSLWPGDRRGPGPVRLPLGGPAGPWNSLLPSPDEPIGCRPSSASPSLQDGNTAVPLQILSSLRIHPSPSPLGHTSCFPGHRPSSHYDPNGPGGHGCS